jgi:hypothetical protein
VTTAGDYYPIWYNPGVGDPGGTIGGGGTPTPSPTPAPSPVPPAPPPPTSAILPAIVASALRSGGSLALATIPVQAVPSQTFTVQLGNQSCHITIYQKRTGLYLDLFADGAPIGVGILCHDRVWLIRDAYLGFVGDLAFIDTQGTDDPDYTSLGTRFVLVWGH